MPRSKRAKLITLSKTQKKGKELTERLFTNVRRCLDSYQTCFVFSVDNMRNTFLKEVRNELSDSRIFFGKTKVMAKALGNTAEDEYHPNLHKLAVHLAGNVGLLFTNRPTDEILSYVSNYRKSDYARAGIPASIDFTIPEGTVFSSGGRFAEEDDVPMEHSLEPALRSLGAPSRLVRGKVTLDQPYEVCKEGDTLDGRQTRLLKMFGVEMAEFRISLKAYWSSGRQELTVIPNDGVDSE